MTTNLAGSPHKARELLHPYEKYVALLQDAESQPVANVPRRTDESSVLIRTLSHILYALLATLTKPETGTSSTEPKPCCSREWVRIQQSSRKRGMCGTISWTSTRTGDVKAGC